MFRSSRGHSESHSTALLCQWLMNRATALKFTSVFEFKSHILTRSVASGLVTTCRSCFLMAVFLSELHDVSGREPPAALWPDWEDDGVWPIQAPQPGAGHETPLLLPPPPEQHQQQECQRSGLKVLNVCRRLTPDLCRGLHSSSACVLSERAVP